MALIECPECNKQVSDRAQTCPQCGTPINIESYVKTVEEEIIEDFIGDHFGLIMHSVPTILKEDQVDTSSELIKSTLQDKSLQKESFWINSWAAPRPTLYGVLGTDNHEKPTYLTYIHRTGYIGFAHIIEMEQMHTSGGLVKVVYEGINNYFTLFLRLSKMVAEKAKIISPFQIGGEFVNAKDAKYSRKPPRFTGSEWKRDKIKLPGVRIENFDRIEEVESLLSERLLNAFGLTRSKG